MAETARQARSPHMDYGYTGGEGVNTATLLFMAAARGPAFLCRRAPYYGTSA